jgi:hypothetical protein
VLLQPFLVKDTLAVFLAKVIGMAAIVSKDLRFWLMSITSLSIETPQQTQL